MIRTCSTQLIATTKSQFTNTRTCSYIEGKQGAHTYRKAHIEKRELAALRAWTHRQTQRDLFLKGCPQFTTPTMTAMGWFRCSGPYKYIHVQELFRDRTKFYQMPQYRTPATYCDEISKFYNSKIGRPAHYAQSGSFGRFSSTTT